MKAALAFYALGLLTMLLLALYLGGENVTQLGLKMTAATTAYDFVASPRESYPVSYSTKELLAYQEAPAVKPVKKGKK